MKYIVRLFYFPQIIDEVQVQSGGYLFLALLMKVFECCCLDSALWTLTVLVCVSLNTTGISSHWVIPCLSHLVFLCNDRGNFVTSLSSSRVLFNIEGVSQHYQTSLNIFINQTIEATSIQVCGLVSNWILLWFKELTVLLDSVTVKGAIVQASTLVVN